MPGNRARGSFAYRATAAPHPPSTSKPDDAAGCSNTSIAPLPPASTMQPETTTSSSATGGDMEIDNPFSLPSASSFTSSNKRSFAMSSGSGQACEDVISHFSTSDVDPTTDDPAAKRMKTCKGKRPAGPPAKITQATAVVGMQASINRLTDIFERSQQPSQPQDRVLEKKGRALKLVQERDDGFDVGQKVALISIFEENPTTIDTYLGLTDSELRQAWISHLLAKV